MTINLQFFKALFVFAILISSECLAQKPDELFKKYNKDVKLIIQEANKDSSSWDRLAYMCDTYGPRISGSENLNNAIMWIYNQMRLDKLDNVQLDEVKVPNWKRGFESCDLVHPRNAKMKILALGGSVATPIEGITAEVAVFESKDDLFKNKEKAKGKIVLFNAKFTNYGETVQYRVNGATWAAQCGAIASLIRSVSPHGMSNPHTGVMYYSDSTVAKIPHGAITEEDADMLDRFYEDGLKPAVNLKLSGHFLPDAISYNCMGEILGSEKPEEIIAIGGHIDSWDVGTGAQDDASGCIATWEAVKLLKKLGLKPKRTIRAVMWVNEENGTAGGKDYAKRHKNEKHFGAFELDEGVFPPTHIKFTGDSALYKKVQKFEPLLKLVREEMKVDWGGGGVDISPLKEYGVPQMSLQTDDKGMYFWYHHSDTDTVDKVDKKDLNDCVAAIAVAMYLYANIEE